jgi:hypothetical protein
VTAVIDKEHAVNPHPNQMPQLLCRLLLKGELAKPKLQDEAGHLERTFSLEKILQQFQGSR